MHEVAQRPSERRSLEVNLFRLNGFKSHYKFTRETNDWQTLCLEWPEISLTVLLVTCHDVKDRIFDPWISRQTGTKSPLKWHNQPEKLLEGVIIKGRLLSSKKNEPLHFAPLSTVWTPGTGFTSILGNIGFLRRLQKVQVYIASVTPITQIFERTKGNCPPTPPLSQNFA